MRTSKGRPGDGGRRAPAWCTAPAPPHAHRAPRPPRGARRDAATGGLQIDLSGNKLGAEGGKQGDRRGHPRVSRSLP
eukprot:5044343-Prymnesium_polylepis.1